MCIAILAVRREWRSPDLKNSLAFFLNTRVITPHDFLSLREVVIRRSVGILYLDVSFVNTDKVQEILPHVSGIVLVGTRKDVENISTNFPYYTLSGLKKSLAGRKVAGSQRTFVPARKQTEEEIEEGLAPSSIARIRKKTK